MRGKSEQSSINESSINTDTQSVQSNPYEQVHHIDNMNINHQQGIYRKPSDELPPSYATVIQSISNQQPAPEPKHTNQNSSSTNHLKPLPNGYIWPRHSTNVVCPTCGNNVNTRVEKSGTIITMVLAIILFILCCCLAILPFCISACKRTTHYCPNCSRMLGERKEFV